MFASPLRPAKLLLGSGSPCHLLRPQPYIAIYSFRAAVPSGDWTLYTLWCGYQHSTVNPKGRGEHQALLVGCVPWLPGCGFPAFFPWRCGDQGCCGWQDWWQAAATALQDPSLVAAL